MIKALVLDDDEDLLEMVTLMLKSQGIDVIQVSSGRDFRAVVANTAPDLVIMDVFLGEYDGRVLCRELKNDQQLGSTKVILYSAGTLDDSITEITGADAFLSKPFDMHTMISTVKDLAGK